MSQTDDAAQGIRDVASSSSLCRTVSGAARRSSPATAGKESAVRFAFACSASHGRLSPRRSVTDVPCVLRPKGQRRVSHGLGLGEARPSNGQYGPLAHPHVRFDRSGGYALSRRIGSANHSDPERNCLAAGSLCVWGENS